MKITINNKEFNLKISMRSIIIWEKISDKTFNPITVTDLILYFYSIILANNPDFEMTFDNFIDYLDEHPGLFNEFMDFLKKENEKQAQFSNKHKSKKK